jgi:gliding motility-associated-like protein
MRKFCLRSTLSLALLCIYLAGNTQDFSNRGKDFWIAYAGHIDGTASVMGLYLTSDVNTSGSVTVGASTIPFTITANQVTKLFIGPGAGGDAPNTFVYNGQSDAINPNAGIHVVAQKNIVVYAHIIRSARSGATLVLPTPVLGKEYIIPSYRNMSTQTGQQYGYGQITIVAVQPNTTVEIIPKVLDRSGTHPADVPFQITLNNVGDVYQLQSQQNLDLSGSIVRSVSSATGGCKPIAVFSSTTWSAFDCAGSSGGDNLYQQLFPIKSWGKKFVTAPFINKPYDIIRVFVIDPATVVTKTELGVTTTLSGLAGGNYYEYKTNNPTIIEATKPVSVVHYITSQTCSPPPNPISDPEMVLINPVEQTLENITLFSAHANHVPVNQTQVTSHFINIVIPTVSKGTLRIDNQPPTAPFTDIVGSGYSFVQENVTASSASNPVHNVKADTGFTAIVYGYGSVESYGYNAGTNLKDLNQFASTTNDYATPDFLAACKNAPFKFSVTFPYQPTVIKWEFNGLFPDVTLNSPAFTSSSVVNGITLYKYDLAGSYTAPATAGTYPFKIIAQNPTPDGCDGVQEMERDLEVFEPPVADFNFTSNGCVQSPVAFTDNTSNPSGRAIIHRHWNFGDASVANDVANTSHTYATAGTYTVKYTVITDIGCKADTVAKLVTLNDPPVAGFTTPAPYCAGKAVTFNDVSAGANIAKWIWSFGDGSPVQTFLTGGSQAHTYAAPGTYSVTLQVETTSGCISAVFSQTITVRPNPVVDFTLPTVCLPAGTAQFNSLSTISDGTESQFGYSWNFGDASPAGTGASPLHTYTAVGPYNVALTVTSNNGCVTTATKTLATVYAEPVASFTAPAEVCLGAAANFNSSASAASGSTVTEWTWSFGDAGSSAVANPSHTYAAAGTYTVTLSIRSAAGCRSVSAANIATKTIVVNPLPVADFTMVLPGCVTRSATFNDGSVPNAGNLVKWTWNFGDGSPPVVTTGGPVTHTYSNVQGFPVSLQVETDKGCVSTITTKNVVINPLPVAEFVPPVICVNDAAAPFNDGSGITGGSVTAWQWNFGDPNATAGNPNTSTAQNTTHHYTLPGNYTAQLIAISNAGCRDTTDKTVTVNGGVITPSFTVQNTAPGAMCSNKTISFKDASQIDAGKIIRVEIFWDNNDLSIKTTDTDPQTGEVYSHAYPEFGSPATRTYTVRFDVYSGLTCVNSTTQTITLLATPVLASNAVAPVCSNADPFQLSVQMLNPNVVGGNGTFTGPGVTQAGMFTPATAGAGTHNIVYTHNAGNGCSNSVTKTIIVDPTPEADAGPDKVVLEGGMVQLTPELIANIPVTYSWSPATWLSNPNIAKPDASPPTDFTYTLTVTSDKGCNTSDDVFVKLLKAPVIPNIFSPNGDGIHDKWVIEYLESYPGCIVQIYNRYGQLIHRVVNYTTPWDGRISGKDAPVGTYYYIIDPKNGRKPITGYVDIIR